VRDRPHGLPRTPVERGAAPFAVDSRETSGGALTVALSGELDVATVAQACEPLESAARARSLVVLDLRELAFVDSSGLHMVATLAERIRARGGRLVIVRGPRAVQRAFELVGMDETLDLVDEPPAAAVPLAVAAVPS
jgi:anti-sigma B factor antagonist